MHLLCRAVGGDIIRLAGVEFMAQFRPRDCCVVVGFDDYAW
jgi:hypothetical protein